MLTDHPLLHEFDVLGHNVVALCAVARKLEGLVALEDVSSSFDQVNKDVELRGMRSQVQRRPGVGSSGEIKLKLFFLLCPELLVSLEYGFDALLLPFSDGRVERTPLVAVQAVCECSVHAE